MKITIHKAIDTCTNLLSELKRLRELGGIKSILTSGGQPTAHKGRETIKELIAHCGQEIEIIAAGSITQENLKAIHKELRAPIYHGRRILGPLS